MYLTFQALLTQLASVSGSSNFLVQMCLELCKENVSRRFSVSPGRNLLSLVQNIDKSKMQS